MAHGGDRSRSPNTDRGQRCDIALTAAQVDEIMQTGVAPCAWFGDRQDSVPAKTAVQIAVSAWHAASPAYRDSVPSHMLAFFASLQLFHRWIDDETMKKCSSRVGSYRIYQDVVLEEVDPEYVLHPFDAGR